MLALWRPHLRARALSSSAPASWGDHTGFAGAAATFLLRAQHGSRTSKAKLNATRGPHRRRQGSGSHLFVMAQQGHVLEAVLWRVSFPVPRRMRLMLERQGAELCAQLLVLPSEILHLQTHGADLLQQVTLAGRCVNGWCRRRTEVSGLPMVRVALPGRGGTLNAGTLSPTLLKQCACFGPPPPDLGSLSHDCHLHTHSRVVKERHRLPQ